MGKIIWIIKASDGDMRRDGRFDGEFYFVVSKSALSLKRFLKLQMKQPSQCIVLLECFVTLILCGFIGCAWDEIMYTRFYLEEGSSLPLRNSFHMPSKLLM
jgi:hypothetical protein